MEIKRIIKEYYEQRYVSKLENLDEVNQLLERYQLPKLTLKEIDRASLRAQWLRICLSMQGTQVRSLVWEDPTCLRASKVRTTTEPVL